jgi:excisionase family DNA binding protein
VTRADVLKAREVAEILGVPESTVSDWARRGVIPSRKRGRRRFYLRWEVEAWLVADDEAALDAELRMSSIAVASPARVTALLLVP